MRKTFSALFAMLCLCATAWAQPQGFGDPLITDASQLSSPFSDSAEGTNIGALCDFNPTTFWHSDWHNEVAGDYHWLQIELPGEMEGQLVLWLKRREADNDHPSEARITGSLTPDFLIEVPIATITLGNAYKGGEFTSDPMTIPSPVRYIRFMPTNCQGSGEGFRKFWHTAEINLYQPADDALVDNMMNEFLNSYDEYLWNDFDLGTNPGQYSDTQSAQAFKEILVKINELLQGIGDRPSADEVMKMIQDGRQYYNLVMASKNEYKLPQDGYYRIVANLDFYEDVETGEVDADGNPQYSRTYVKKTMYSMLEGFAAWHTYDANDCRDLWHITRNGDNTVNMVNAATDMSFTKFSSSIEMSTDRNQWLFARLVWAGRENDQDVLYVQGYGQSQVFHMQGHKRGEGRADMICSWSPTFGMGQPYTSDKGTSEWVLEYVSDEEAQTILDEYELVKNREKMVVEYRRLAAEASNTLFLAQSAAQENYITDTRQFSSQVSESSEGSLGNLLDDNASTFWHSAYNGERAGTVGGTHFIDVTLPQAVSGTLQAMIQRRAACANDHPIEWSVYGANEASALEQVADFTRGDAETWRAQTVEGWTQLANRLSTPYDENVLEVYMPAFTLDVPYKYLRFVCEESTGKTEGTRGFFHLGGMQVFKTIGKSQLEAMGEIGQALVEQIEIASSIAEEDISFDNFNALRTALDAVQARLQDPTELRNTVNTYKTLTERMVVGTNPGFWPNDAAGKALDAAIAAAVDYDKAAVYTEESMSQHIQAIEAAANAYQEAANKVDVAKWYRIRFASEETYRTHGWSTENIAEQENSSYGTLWSNYVAVARYESEGDYEGNATIIPLTTEEMREGNSLFFTTLESITDADAALFRFVSVGDDTFVIQNKATGLFINCRAADDNNVTLSLTPTKFNLSALGYGGVLMAGKKLDGTSVTNLHAQRWNHRLVTWRSDSYDNNSALLIEEAEGVTGGPNEVFYRDMMPGTYYAWSGAYNVTCENEDVHFYTVRGTFNQGEENLIAMNEKQPAPGQAYVAILGSADDYAPEADIEAVPFKVGGSFAEATVLGGLIGVDQPTQVYTGAVVFENNEAVVAEDKVVEDGSGNYVSVSNRNIAAGAAYLSFAYEMADPNGSYDLVVPISGKPTILTEVEKHAGTEEDPLLILSATDMAYLRGKLEPGRMNYVELGADIDMAGITNWIPLNLYDDMFGTVEYANWIHFDGKGHTIRNFSCTNPEQSYNSFFGILNGDVMNVGFENVNVVCLASGSGVLCGYMGHDQYAKDGVKVTSSLTNVWVSGKLRISNNYAGGLIGNVGGPSVLKNIYTNIEIVGENDYTGGFVGRVRDYLSIVNAYAAGSINRGGGIIGGGQKDNTAAGEYRNIVVWNNTTGNFGPVRGGVDQVGDITTFDGTNHAALQAVVVGWGKPWTCDMKEGSYPTFNADGDDAIQSIATREKASGIYTINGIRVEKTQQGLYIINGRKVMVK